MRFASLVQRCLRSNDAGQGFNRCGRHDLHRYGVRIAVAAHVLERIALAIIARGLNRKIKIHAALRCDERAAPLQNPMRIPDDISREGAECAPFAAQFQSLAGRYNSSVDIFGNFLPVRIQNAERQPVISAEPGRAVVVAMRFEVI